MEFLKELYTPNDFEKLTIEDITSLKEELKIEVDKDVNIKEYLFENMNSYEQNDTFKNIVSSKVLAGRTALKWMRFYYADDFNKDSLKGRIESQDLGYNANTIERWDNDQNDGILSIQKNGSFYTLRINITGGISKSVDGPTSYRGQKRNIVIVNIDIENRWIEFRCTGRLRNKAIDIIKRNLKIPELYDISISNKYGNLEEFKKDLTKGYRFSNISIPKYDTELDEDDKQDLVRLFTMIDEFIIGRDGNKFLQELGLLKLNFAYTPIIQVILSNIGAMKFSVPEESEEDLEDSLIYMLTKDYAYDSSSSIRFAVTEDGPEHAMRISVKDSSISFNTSVTEDVIEYIRSKVL